jgi:hypothetical protein
MQERTNSGVAEYVGGDVIRFGRPSLNSSLSRALLTSSSYDQPDGFSFPM